MFKLLPWKNNSALPVLLSTVVDSHVRQQ